MMRKTQYNDDDGHTVADMSYLGKHPMLGTLFVRIPPDRDRGGSDKSKEEEQAQEQEPLVLTRKERRYAILGATKAALLIGLVYAGALIALVVLLMVLWHAF